MGALAALGSAPWPMLGSRQQGGRPHLPIAGLPAPNSCYAPTRHHHGSIDLASGTSAARHPREELAAVSPPALRPCKLCNWTPLACSWCAQGCGPHWLPLYAALRIRLGPPSAAGCLRRGPPRRHPREQGSDGGTAGVGGRRQPAPAGGAGRARRRPPGRAAGRRGGPALRHAVLAACLHQLAQDLHGCGCRWRQPAPRGGSRLFGRVHGAVRAGGPRGGLHGTGVCEGANVGLACNRAGMACRLLCRNSPP